jgi:indolepyruvate ferredoxin oxidoreductase, alpha subunit
MLAASVNYPIRGAVTFKSPVGINVASDAIANLASGGVTGGALIIIGEDYGEGSSIMQERSHPFAMKSQVWLLDPRPNLPTIVKAVEDGFDLSEASHTPVMLEVRIRACHVHGRFAAKDNKRPSFPLREALEKPRRDTARVVLPPASYQHEREKIEQRWPAAVKFIKERKLNEFFGPDVGEVGIVVQGGLYNSVMRSLQQLGLADVYGETAVPIYVLNVTYPLIDDEVAAFAIDKKAILMVEEGQPEFIEQALNTILRRRDIQTKICGKDVLPMAGEYTPAVVTKGIKSFLEKHAPALLGNAPPTPDAAAVLADPKIQELAKTVPPRPPGFCVGCPERPVFAAMKLVQKELGEHNVAGDIGCHLFASLPPFNIGATTMGYGLGPASSSAFNVKADKRPISIIGDGGFWHNGLSSSVANAVYNKHDGVIMVVDNFYSAATGGQDIMSSRALNPARSTNNTIVNAVKGVGVKWVRHLDRTYDVGRMRDILRDALTTKESGPKVIVASSECMLNKQRRVKPLFQKSVRDGQRAVQERFGVDEDVCTGDHACIRLSGCPSLSVKHTDDPLKDDPVAAIDNNCVGCGNCGEVSEAAVLCPSFYRADIIHNPNSLDRFFSGLRRAVIGFLQRRREASRIVFAD